jgi:hypothetical protein
MVEEDLQQAMITIPQIILFLGLLLGDSAAIAPGIAPPDPLTPADKAQIQSLQIRAYQLLAQKLQAEVDAAKANDKFRDVNDELTKLTQELYQRYKTDGKWILKPDFSWAETQIKPTITPAPTPVAPVAPTISKEAKKAK